MKVTHQWRENRNFSRTTSKAPRSKILNSPCIKAYIALIILLNVIIIHPELLIINLGLTLCTEPKFLYNIKYFCIFRCFWTYENQDKVTQVGGWSCYYHSTHWWSDQLIPDREKGKDLFRCFGCWWARRLIFCSWLRCYCLQALLQLHP